MYAAIASNPFLRVDEIILKVLESGNDMLMNILNEFILLYNSPTVENYPPDEEKFLRIPDRKRTI